MAYPGATNLDKDPELYAYCLQYVAEREGEDFAKSLTFFELETQYAILWEQENTDADEDEEDEEVKADRQMLNDLLYTDGCGNQYAENDIPGWRHF